MHLPRQVLPRQASAALKAHAAFRRLLGHPLLTLGRTQDLTQALGLQEPGLTLVTQQGLQKKAVCSSASGEPAASGTEPQALGAVAQETLYTSLLIFFSPETT